jgi:hypothetical protein
MADSRKRRKEGTQQGGEGGATPTVLIRTFSFGMDRPTRIQTAKKVVTQMPCTMERIAGDLKLYRSPWAGNKWLLLLS